MIFTKKLCIIISIILAAACLRADHAYCESDPLEAADSYVLAEAATGKILLEKNSRQPRDTGCLGKLMTLLLIAEDIETGKYSLDTELTASQTVVGTKGAVIWLEPGDKMTVDELLKAVIIGNANDAVTVLAEKSEGTIEKFTARMNMESFDLGLRDSVFLSPWGYYGEGSRSTAADIAVICARLSRYEMLRDYFCTWREFIKNDQTELVNENTLARTYDRHIGFKASHIDESYSIAEGGMNEKGERYIAVVLDHPDRDGCMRSAKKLIEQGSREYKVTGTMFPEETLMPVKVRGGCESAVEIGLRRQSELVIPKGVDQLSMTAVIPKYIDAPVKYGQVIGTAAFYSGKELVWETDIIAVKDVEKLDFGYTLEKMLVNLLK